MNTQTTPISILVAEDDADDVIFFEEAVRKIELPVELAFFENGRKLIENLRQRRSLPSLIFLDLNMPEMDGREACEEILSDPDLNFLPLIILTTSNDDSDREFCLRHGVKSFVTKPVGIDELTDIVRQLIGEWVVYKKLSPDTPPHPESVTA